MATPTDKGFLLTDNEAAAINRWVTKQPKARRGLHAGAESVAYLIGRSRVHLAYAIAPATDKRKPIGRDDLAAIVRMLMEDARARYELRRVAEDNLQAMMDTVQLQGSGRVVMENDDGVMLLIPKSC